MRGAGTAEAPSSRFRAPEEGCVPPPLQKVTDAAEKNKTGKGKECGTGFALVNKEWLAESCYLSQDLSGVRKRLLSVKKSGERVGRVERTASATSLRQECAQPVLGTPWRPV